MVTMELIAELIERVTSALERGGCLVSKSDTPFYSVQSERSHEDYQSTKKK